MIKTLIIASIAIIIVLFLQQHLISVEKEFADQLINDIDQQSYSHQFKTFSLTNTDANGEIQSVIHSPTTRMVSAKQITLMEDPEFIMQRNQEPPVVITAENAEVFHSTNKTSLTDNVKVVMSNKNQNNIVMTTQQLTIDNKTQQASTDLPATIVHGKGNMQGTGVEFDPNSKQIKFLSEVRGIYEN